ncbi:MAG: hypothetical protein LH629_13350 [Ignavibacteria bacterium]|nr:hypothetical protein [Ignavibacteria bacterium]
MGVPVAKTGHIPRFWVNHIFDAAEFKKYLLDNSKIKYVLPNPYFLEGWKKNDPLAGDNRESYNPPKLNYSGDYDPMEDRLVYKANTVEDYETWLKNKFEYAV